ncbi:MAG: DUF2878 domain-containing protein [Hyphomicrobiaceae bacterium]
MNWRGIAEFAAFQVVWIACALGAAAGSNAIGVAAAGALIGVHLCARYQVSPAAAKGVALTVLACGIIGLAAESLLAAAGLVRYAAPWPSPHVAPPWVVALWLAFGTTLAATASLLGGRLAIAAVVLGAVFGPLSYLAGAKLGAVTIVAPQWQGYGAIAIIWAVAYPLLLQVSRPLHRDAAG